VWRGLIRRPIRTATATGALELTRRPLIALLRVPAHADEGVAGIQGEGGDENEDEFHPQRLSFERALAKQKLPPPGG
jgi:hypothetical protein